MSKIKQIFGLFLAFILLSATAHAGAPARERKVYPKITEPLANVYLVIHGGDQIEVNFHRIKKAATSAGLIAGGGLVGALIGVAVASHGDEAAQQDMAEQDTLNQQMLGWNFGNEFKDSLLNQLAPNLKNVTVAYVEYSNTAFPVVEQSFYNRGKQSYNGEEKTYDYTALAAQGATHVIEIDLRATMSPSSGFSKKMTPIFVAHGVVISLADKEVLLSQRSVKLGTKVLKDTYDNISAHPDMLKNAIATLASTVATQLSKKLK